MKYLSIHPAEFNFFLIWLTYYCCHTHCRLLCYSFVLSSIPAFVEQMLLPYLDSHLIHRFLKDWDNVNIIFSPFVSSFSPVNVAWNGDLLEVGPLENNTCGGVREAGLCRRRSWKLQPIPQGALKLGHYFVGPKLRQWGCTFLPPCWPVIWMQQASRKEM